MSDSLQPYGLYSSPGSSVHGILQERMLQWVAICPPPGALPDPGIEPMYPVAPALQADSLSLRHWGSPYSIHSYYKILAIFPVLHNASLQFIYFLHSSLNLLFPHPCLASPFLLLTGNHQFVLCTCKLVSFFKYSLFFIFRFHI